LIQERKKEIDVIDRDNLWTLPPFFHGFFSNL